LFNSALGAMMIHIEFRPDGLALPRHTPNCADDLFLNFDTTTRRNPLQRIATNKSDV